MTGAVCELFFLGLFAAIVRSRFREVFPGVAGGIKAMVASVLSLGTSLGALALFVSTRKDPNDLSDAGARLLATSLVVLAVAVVGSPVAARDDPRRRSVGGSA